MPVKRLREEEVDVSPDVGILLDSLKKSLIGRDEEQRLATDHYLCAYNQLIW